MSVNSFGSERPPSPVFFPEVTSPSFSQNKKCLTKKRMIAILEKSLQSIEHDLTLKNLEVKNDTTCRKFHLFVGIPGLVVYGFEFLGNFISLSYGCVRNYLSLNKFPGLLDCYSKWHPIDYLYTVYDPPFLKIFSYLGMVAIMSRMLQPCYAWNRHRQAKQGFTFTTVKIQHLIKTLGFSQGDSLSMKSLSSELSDLEELPEESFKAMLREMNMSQLLELRAHLQSKKLRSILSRLLPKDASFFMDFLEKLQSESIFDQIKDISPLLANLLERHIIVNDPTVWDEMVKLSDPNCREDEAILLQMGEKLLGSKEMAEQAIFNLRMETSETLVFAND